MFLKSMDLFGFKSFADKTRINFEPGITVIVGPNGCGKSNTMDAVKWVLGEKYAKSLRGTKMEDIIFNGTEQRKPLSLAEVSLTLDNSNRILDLDSDSITVGRRVFRDGESEYFINKSPVRLKEIEALFMDTGIGKSAYSVMEQGKIDMILSTKPEDRRFLFEEAAGISRFKFQQKESLKKLENTENNLHRINDIIREIEREKNIKAKQAEKTKNYLSMRERLMDLDAKLNYLNHLETTNKKIKLLAEIEKLKQERESISAKISKISAENEKDEKLKNDIQLQLFELDKELHTCHIKVEDIDSKTEKNRMLIKEQHKRNESILIKMGERVKSIEKLREEKNKTRKAGIEIVKRLEDDREELKGLFEIQERKIDSIKSSRNKINENKKKIILEEEDLRKQRAILEVVIKRLLDVIEKRKAELVISEENRQKVRRRINERLNNIDIIIHEVLKLLESGKTRDAVESLSMIDIESLKVDILKFEKYEDGFRSILFDKTGIHARKEELDKKILEKVSIIEDLRGEINALDEYINEEQAILEDANRDISLVEKNLSKNENEKNWIEKHLNSLSMQIKDIEQQIDNYQDDISHSEGVIEKLAGEIREYENFLLEFNSKSESLKKSINEHRAGREEVHRLISKRTDIYKKDIENQKRIVDKINEKDRSLVELNYKISGIEEYFWTEYEKNISDFKDIPHDEMGYESIKNNILELKKSIQDIGPINNLAIEEYKELQKRFNYYTNHKEDIEKAREDILSILKELVETSARRIRKTFDEIKNNFSYIFKQLFEGGDATIELTDESNILESGIEINARPPGKKPKSINLLSGGERALTAIALLFATFMVKPSPFYFLDEIDAPLDEENVGRFTRMVKKFARNTQFIIITHNKKTISAGESIYGVTMEEFGVSRFVSMKIDRIEKKAV